MGITEDRAKQLAAFLGRVCDVTSLMLVLYHLGPYLLIAQPVRTYLLKSMQPGGRRRFLGCLERVSLGWARHQRDAALVALQGRRQKVRLGREGLRSEGPSAVIVEPE